MQADTRAIHGTPQDETVTGATAVPIYQTTAYAYATARQLADVFDGQDPGFLYTRIANPTTQALERRLAALEDGIGCIATASGMAAIASVALALLRTGDEILAAQGIFGGTVSLFHKTLARFGVKTTFVDVAYTEQFAAALNPKTKMIFVETIGNPHMDVPDLPEIARIARAGRVPLVVDNTLTTPLLIRPKEFGADIIIHSTSKFINGHGTAIGGAIIDAGTYDWAGGPFDDIRSYARRAGQQAFLAYLRHLIYRDLGPCPAPMNSFLMLQGLETLPARIRIHCDNARRLARFLQAHPAVSWVNYPGLPDSAFHNRVARLFAGSAGALLTFGLGSRAAAFRFIDALRLALNLANLGDAKTLVLHPASTIFHEFTPEEQRQMGIPPDMVRVSVGLEDFTDIQEDFAHALSQV